jgi:O-antigen ligase
VLVESLLWLLFPAANLLSISAGQVIAVLLFLFWLPRAGRKRLLPGVFLPLLALLAWTLVSGLSGDPAHWYQAIGKWPVLLMALVAYDWAKSGQDISRPLTALFAVATLLVPYEVWSFLYTEYGRAKSFTGGAPNLGTILMMALVFGSAFLLVSKGRQRKWMTVAVIACLIGLLLSMNRSALLGLFAAFAVMAVPRVPMLAPAFLAMLTFSMAVAPDSAYSWRVRSFFYPHLPSTRERPRLWASGLKMVRDRPLAGFATRDNFQAQYSSRFRSPQSEEKGTPGHVHNSYIHTAVLHGIPGLGLVLWLLCVLWRNIRSVSAGVRNGPWKQAAAMSLAPIFLSVLVNAFFDFVLADGQRAMMFYTLTGLLLGSINRSRREFPK